MMVARRAVAGRSHSVVELDDGELPVISQLQVSNVTTTSAIISWQTSEPADTQVAYGPSANYGSTSPHVSTPTETHVVHLTNLDPYAVQWQFEVRNRDAAGNLARGSGGFAPPPLH